MTILKQPTRLSITPTASGVTVTRSYLTLRSRVYDVVATMSHSEFAAWQRFALDRTSPPPTPGRNGQWRVPYLIRRFVDMLDVPDHTSDAELVVEPAPTETLTPAESRLRGKFGKVSADEKARILAAWDTRDSGISKRTFCSARGISPGTLNRWLRARGPRLVNSALTA